MTIFSIIYSWYSFFTFTKIGTCYQTVEIEINQLSVKNHSKAHLLLGSSYLYTNYIQRISRHFILGQLSHGHLFFHWSCIFVGRFPTQHLQTTLPFSTGVRPSTLAFTGTGNRFTSFTIQSPVLLSRTTEVPIRFCTS